MGEIINLRRRRKNRARNETELVSAQNRVNFGRTKVGRQKQELQANKAQRSLDGHKREVQKSDFGDMLPRSPDEGKHNSDG